MKIKSKKTLGFFDGNHLIFQLNQPLKHLFEEKGESIYEKGLDQEFVKK